MREPRLALVDQVFESVGGGLELDANRLTDSALLRDTIVKPGSEALAFTLDADPVATNRHALDSRVIELEREGTDVHTGFRRPDATYVLQYEVDHPRVLVVVDSPVDGRPSIEWIVVLEAVRTFGAGAEKHHPNEPFDEFAGVRLQLVIVESNGRHGQRLCDVAVGHRPDASVPGTVHSTAFPVRTCTEQRVVPAR